MQHFTPLFLAALALTFASSGEAADLRVDIHGISGAGGRVYAAVFKRAEDFPKADISMWPIRHPNAKDRGGCSALRST